MTSKTQKDNNLDLFYSPDPEIFAKNYLDYLSQVLQNISTKEIAIFTASLLDARERGASIFFAGNGGSAADSQHIAAELVGIYKNTRKGLSAIALTTDTSSLTSIGNDFG
jgi:D-sedoheptulose 7-phosphate isomerase